MKIKPGRKYINENLRTMVEYPPELQLTRQRSSFAVFKPYKIIEEDGQLYIVAWWWADMVAGENLEALNKEGAHWQGSHTYNPFRVPYLFEEIGRVNPTSEKSILEFCNQYGLLGESAREVPAHLAGLKFEGWGDYRESLYYFARSVREMQDTLRLYYDIKRENPQLEERAADMVETLLELHPEWQGRLKNADALTIARARLMVRVNKHLGTVFPALQLGIDGRLYPGHTGLTLLGIAYFQLYEIITSDAQLRECPNCNSLFVPRTHRARFCPAPAGYGRSPCENRYNQMIARVRKNIKEGKETVEQAAARLGRAVEEVRSWVEAK